MNIVRLCPLEVGATIATDKDGREHVLAVGKGTFDIMPDGSCVLASKQKPLVRADEYYGEPGISSVRYESDFVLRKPKADVVINGTAYALKGSATQWVDTTLKLGPINKTIRVYGERKWKRNLFLRLSPSKPEPFQKMPLLYERAFGGVDRNSKGEGKPFFELANLVGVGFHYRKNRKIKGSSLPNLEYPRCLIRNPKDKPPPAGFGFVSRNWKPRTTYAGTYDQAWLDERFPFLPADFQDKYFQGAPEDQTCSFLRGGEPVSLINLTPDGKLDFWLPQMAVPVKLLYRSHEVDLTSMIDTVIIEPDAKQCLLVWRTSTRLEGKLHHLHEIWVGTPTKARLRALKSGKRYVDWAELNRSLGLII